MVLKNWFPFYCQSSVVGGRTCDVLRFGFSQWNITDVHLKRMGLSFFWSSYGTCRMWRRGHSLRPFLIPLPVPSIFVMKAHTQFSHNIDKVRPACKTHTAPIVKESFFFFYHHAFTVHVGKDSEQRDFASLTAPSTPLSMTNKPENAI